jgi:hypothetical protein
VCVCVCVCVYFSTGSHLEISYLSKTSVLSQSVKIILNLPILKLEFITKYRFLINLIITYFSQVTVKSVSMFADFEE